MKLISIEDQFKKYSEYGNYYINVKAALVSGNITSLKKYLDEYGIGFLLLGPCDQCGNYFDKYIIFKAKDDYCRDIDCFVCENCLNNSLTLIKEDLGKEWYLTEKYKDKK